MSDEKELYMKNKIKGIKGHTVVPIGPGEAHLKNNILDSNCYICESNNKEKILLRKGEKDMVFCCLEHHGVVQEFIHQYQRVPLGWEVHKDGKNESTNSKT